METWSIIKGSRRRARPYQLVHDGIHQRLERGIDDVGRDADSGPALAAFVLALDQDAGHRFGAAVEDAHAVVGQLEPVDIALVFPEILAQREVQRVDRTDAFRGRDQRLAVNLDLDDRQRHRDALADRIVALFDIDVELFDVEVIRHHAEYAPRQEFERGIGSLVGIADRLALLNHVKELHDAGIVLVYLQANALELRQHVG